MVNKDNMARFAIQEGMKLISEGCKARAFERCSTCPFGVYCEAIEHTFERRDEYLPFNWEFE